MEGTAAAPFSGAPSADPLVASLSSQWREAGRRRQRRNAAAVAGESSASAVEGPAICMTRCAAATDDPPEAGGPGGYRSGSVCRARTGAIGAGRPTRRRRLSRCRAAPGHRPRTTGGRPLRPRANLCRSRLWNWACPPDRKPVPFREGGPSPSGRRTSTSAHLQLDGVGKSLDRGASARFHRSRGSRDHLPVRAIV